MTASAPGFGSAALLTTWEDCHGRTHADVALRMLQMAEPDVGLAALASLPVSDRDRRLLALRSLLFGDAFDMRTECPMCDEQLELAGTGDEFIGTCAGPRDFDIGEGDDVATFRVPTSRDVALAMRAPTSQERLAALWERCVRYRHIGTSRPVDEMPLELAVRVETALLEVDGHAITGLELTCPGCDYSWIADFDIVTILWAELDARLRRELFDVHRLAAAYGWSEDTVLSLSPRRRQYYLEQV